MATVVLSDWSPDTGVLPLMWQNVYSLAGVETRALCACCGDGCSMTGVETGVPCACCGDGCSMTGGDRGALCLLWRWVFYDRWRQGCSVLVVEMGVL